jgi:hypothetical protein
MKSVWGMCSSKHSQAGLAGQSRGPAGSWGHESIDQRGLGCKSRAEATGPG